MRSIFVFMFILALTPAKADEAMTMLKASQASIDHSVQTASITRVLGDASRPTLILKKTDRLRPSAADNQVMMERMDPTSDLGQLP